MPRPGLSKELVINAIDALVANGELPTALKVRAYLGTGSLATIQKYFKIWKLESFVQHANNEQSIYEQNTAVINKDAIESQEQFIALETKLAQLSQQHQALVAELIKVEQDNLHLGSDNEKLTGNLNEITAQYKTLLLEHQNLVSKYQELKEERESTVATLLTDKNAQIQRLEQEVKTINEKYLQAVKEVGRYGDDQLIAEKVKTINLSAQIVTLQNHNQRLEEELEQAVKVKEPLVRALKQQQDLVSRFVSWEQLNEYAQENQADDAAMEHTNE